MVYWLADWLAELLGGELTKDFKVNFENGRYEVRQGGSNPPSQNHGHG